MNFRSACTVYLDHAECVTCGVFLSFPSNSMGECIRWGPDRKEKVHTQGGIQESLTKGSRKPTKDDDAAEVGN